MMAVYFASSACKQSDSQTFKKQLVLVERKLYHLTLNVPSYNYSFLSHLCSILLLHFLFSCNVFSIFRLRNALYNTFCVNMKFTKESPVIEEETCFNLDPFTVSYDYVKFQEHVSSTPPLKSYILAPAVETKTARKKVEIQPTEIRLKKGLRSFDKPRTDRIVLDFGSSDLVSSAVN